MESLRWLEELKEKVPEFLRRLEGKKVPGFYRYSLTGDLFSEEEHWGLGNTVFAVKILYTLDLLKTLSSQRLKDLEGFIKSFHHADGTFYDPLIKRKAFLKDKLAALRLRNFQNFFHKQTIRAETRQAVSALALLNSKPQHPYQEIPSSEKEVYRFLESLNWTRPWGAGSHFSHLLFFLSRDPSKRHLIDPAIQWINRLQHPEDGAWYRGNPPLNQKINGAMKVITGLQAAGRLTFDYPERLVDLALTAANSDHACDNFNVVYVAKYAGQITGFSYRQAEIRDFAYNRLKIYRSYYFPEHGGFSFLPGRADVYYYGVRITKGLREPDIHGTVMFLWGIALISQILDLDLGFKEFVT